MTEIIIGPSLKREMIEDFLVFIGLIGMQFVYAGNSVLSSLLMSFGINPHTLVITCTFSTFLFLTPIAVCFERYHSCFISLFLSIYEQREMNCDKFSVSISPGIDGLKSLVSS